jgi:DNA primase
MDIEGFTEYHELISFLNNGQFDELQFKEEKIELAESKPIYLPEGFRNISLGNSQLAKSIRGYVKKRGFSVDQFSRYGIGYGTMGETYGYLIIPFYYHGQLKYYNARNVIGKGPRYNNPDKDITGLGKQFIIFNHDALEMYRSVFVCEGALNALTMGDRGIATMGKAISKYQVNELLKSQCERYIILLDPDAKEYAINLALKLVAYKKVKVVFLPEGKDCNDLGKSAVMRLVYSTRYQSYQELIAIRNSLK